MEQIIELLKHWAEFEKSDSETTIHNFAKWLKSKTQTPKKVYNNPYESELNTAFGYQFGRLFSFAEAWERLTFRNFPINGYSDLFILKFVQFARKPSKKEIAKASREENTTVFEAIKRMTKIGLLSESIDSKDRRVRRVSLTFEGQKLIEAIDLKSANMSNLMVGDLNSDEIARMTELLKSLGDFHERLYYSESKPDIVQRYDL